jgi:hypothetical protein
MADYRCYFLNDQRHIVGFEAITECEDDTAARRIAITLLNRRPQYSGVAVWERSRKVFEELLSKVG